jgi:thiol:disulfide interchange protein DsbD
VCYPPNPQTLQVALAAMSTAPAAPIEAAGGAPEDESSKLAGLLKNAGFWLILTTFFGAGLLLALTPCVLPMVPILSGIIVGHGHAIAQGPRLLLSMAYVLGMAVDLRRRRRRGRPVRLDAVGGAAERLGAGRLRPGVRRCCRCRCSVSTSCSCRPSCSRKLSDESANHRRGSLRRRGAHGRALGADRRSLRGGAAGRRAALHRADARRGARRTALFAMALGMGVPLVIVGVSTRSLLPHTGPWMEASRSFFGVLLLALPSGSSRRCCRPGPCWRLGRRWLIGIGVFLRALDPLPPHATTGRAVEGRRRGRAAGRRQRC